MGISETEFGFSSSLWKSGFVKDRVMTLNKHKLHWWDIQQLLEHRSRARIAASLEGHSSPHLS